MVKHFLAICKSSPLTLNNLICTAMYVKFLFKFKPAKNLNGHKNILKSTSNGFIVFHVGDGRYFNGPFFF